MTGQQITDERRQIEQDNLAELIEEYTRSAGEFTAEELVTARTALYGDGPDARRAGR
jgi:hypothetical protein